ncbi:alginate lyase family protein [Fodinibius salsisoli]|uniref:Alginate lyase family protein n=1 Tax=Fodinibius salsisoli TaxID=2820877 RepID=A0ABT3PJH8_9BACT|nr:alginate lyase family protein [Fodinibius salsisoli]MCW9706076.1 alginate lyase family protein [Fodinibius salsisoli]
MKLFFYPLFWVMFLALLTGCKENEHIASIEEENKKDIVRGSQPSYPNLYIDSLTVASIQKEMKESGKAATAFNNFVTAKANAGLNKEPIAIPHITGDNETTVKDYCKTTLLLSIQWVFEEDSTQKRKYLQKTVDFLLQFSQNYSLSDHTPRETALLPMFEAYSIVRDALTNNERKSIDKWLLDQAQYYKNGLKLSGKLAINNWNTIRLNILTYISLITENEILYEHAISELKSFIPKNIYADGTSHDFEDRDAFAYHAYNLLFYAKIFKSIKLSGNISLYDEPDFSRVKKAVDFWESYLLEPNENQHIEFLDTKYPPDKERSDYNEPYNPATSIYVLEELMASESRCINYITTIDPSITKYNLSFDYWVNQKMSK